MFPSKLSDLDHLRDNPMIRFKEEVVNGQSFTIVSYMIGNSELWELPHAIECRGITFDTETGRCVCAPFNKFFNVGERNDTQIPMIEGHYIECYEKVDGSMVTPVLIDGEVVFKTKKSFYSDVAIQANQSCPDKVRQLCKRALRSGYTPIFEFTHPSWRIVLDYGKEPRFVLLTMRSFRTGKFSGYNIYNYFGECCQIDTVKRYFNKGWADILQDIATLRDFEGYVLLLDDKRRVKIKTQWYLEMHRTMTQLRRRDVAEMVVNETIDDCKSLLSSQGMSLDCVEEIEIQVTNELAQIRQHVEDAAKVYAGQSFKEVALDLQAKKDPMFGLIMSAVRGKEPDYIDYWKRNYLSAYTLEGVYNTIF